MGGWEKVLKEVLCLHSGSMGLGVGRPSARGRCAECSWRRGVGGNGGKAGEWETGFESLMCSYNYGPDASERVGKRASERARK